MISEVRLNMISCDGCSTRRDLGDSSEVPEDWALDTQDRPYAGDYRDEHYCPKCAKERGLECAEASK